MSVKQTAGRKVLGELAPKFAELNDDILFGEVWSREDKLSLRDRSMITVTAILSKGLITDALKSHIENAKKNGVTKEEMVELVTHVAFYAGWPNAWAVFPMVMEIYKDEKSLVAPLFGLGEYNKAYEKYFTGKSYLNPLCGNEASIANVTFEPGCRNYWHIHHVGGQILLCTEGEGWYQEEGKKAQSLHAGDVVYIAPEVKHWHGAKKNSWFTHIALSVPTPNASTEWCEEVSDEQYLSL